MRALIEFPHASSSGRVPLRASRPRKQTACEGPGQRSLDAFDPEFWRAATSPAGLEDLFEHLPDVYFFVKDRHSRFARVNRAFADLVRAESLQAVLGARDYDFFPSDLADSYARDDREVMSSRQPLVDKVELVRRPDGATDWFCTTKLPLLDAQGQALGVCGITRDIKKMGSNVARLMSWAPVLESMMADYELPLSTEALARKMGFSESQFRRHFRKKFGMSPRTYLTKVRLTAACHLLVTTELPLSDVAIRTGFYDQSHFSNQFSKCYGLSPSKYRARHIRRAQSESLDTIAASSISGVTP